MKNEQIMKFAVSLNGGLCEIGLIGIYLFLLDGVYRTVTDDRGLV